jgi:hypothetical protein
MGGRFAARGSTARGMLKVRLTSESFIKWLNGMATSAYAKPTKELAGERVPEISVATCLDRPIAKGCEHFHLMQLASFKPR